MVKCLICNKMLPIGRSRRTSTTKKQNIVLMMSLSLAGYMDTLKMRRLIEDAVHGRPFICHEHTVHAAQYVLAEMVAKGKHLAHFEDPSACGRTAYVTDGDIPQEIVDALNRKAKDYDEITPRDVSTFLNDALKRYYSTSMWPVNEETNGETVDEGENSVGMESMPDSDKHFSLVKLEDEKPTSSISRVDEFPPDHESISTSNNKPSLQETDPADLDRYYLVKGKMLMQLFRLCPRCGHRLNGAQLCAAGTAAVVKFLCDDCSIQQPVVRRWDSQDRKEQIFNCGT